jgi:hypothetical protein
MQNFKEIKLSYSVAILLAKSDRELDYRDLLEKHVTGWLKDRAIPFENLTANCEEIK